MLKNILDSKRCFKLICGAGNEDIESVKRLVYVYALAGCKIFDLCNVAKPIVIFRNILHIKSSFNGIFDDLFFSIN